MTDLKDEFMPSKWGMADIRSAIPTQLFEISTFRGIKILARNVSVAVCLGWIAVVIDKELKPWNHGAGFWEGCLPTIVWVIYWWFQSLAFTGIWILGHECGHGSFSNSKVVCDSIGIVCHTFLWTPYYSWKYSHKLHHRYHAHMEKDQHWIPRTRAETVCMGLLANETTSSVFDVPVMALLRLIVQQVIGFPCYLLFNATGQTSYPKWTSHFNPLSVIFQFDHRPQIIISNLLIISAVYATHLSTQYWGFGIVLKVYGVPCLLVSHWVLMIVFLQHTDAKLPHYSPGSWTYTRGALATMDRPFLGWQGRFFLHDVAHFHVIHHFFPKMPFYHAEEATLHLKRLLGPDYHYSDQAVFKSLWLNMSACHHVDDEGDVLYWKDKNGSNRWLDSLAQKPGSTEGSSIRNVFD